MEIAVAVLLFLVAIFLVVKGGDIFVESSTQIAKRLKIPQIIFGATVVSLATTLPELIITILSSIDGTNGLAVGNSVGSALCNIGLTCGISFIAMTLDISKDGVLKYYLNLFVFLIILIFGLFMELTLWQGIVLVGLVLVFFVFNYIDAKSLDNKNKKHSKQKPVTVKNLKPLWLCILLFVVGAVCVGGGAYILVDKVEYFSKLIGVSEQFVGLTIVAVGTSLPELITVFNAIKTKSPYLAIGNIIGSNIINVTLILGVARLCLGSKNIPITAETAYVSLPLLFLLCVIMIIPMLVKKRTYKLQGFMLLGLYVLYVIYLVFNAIYNFM